MACRREEDLLSVGANEPGDLSAGHLDRLFTLPAVQMRAAVRVAVLVYEERQHRVQHAWVYGRGRLHVEIQRLTS